MSNESSCGCGGCGCGSNSNEGITITTRPMEDAMSQNTITLKIDGMTCGHCVSSVTEELNGVPGVSNVEVFLSAGGTSTATVTTNAPVENSFSKKQSRRPAIRSSPRAPIPLTCGRVPDHTSGPPPGSREERNHEQRHSFPVNQRIVELDIQGMTCASCVGRVERKLGKIEGVEARVSCHWNRHASRSPRTSVTINSSPRSSQPDTRPASRSTHTLPRPLHHMPTP